MIIPKFLKLLGWSLVFLLAGNVIVYWLASGNWSFYQAVYTFLNLAILFIVFRKIRKHLGLIQSILKSLNDPDFAPDRYKGADKADPVVIELFGHHKRTVEAVGHLQSIFKENNENHFEHLGENDTFRKVITDIRSGLEIQKQEAQERNWIVKGLATFGELIRNEEQDMSGLCNILIRRLVNYTDSSQGAIFIADVDENGGHFLKQMSCYAYDQQRSGEKTMQEGQGLLGQCMLEKETIHLKKVPEGYINITSGLGDATPSSVVIVPLMANEVFYGAIELASFNIIEGHQISFLEKLGENLALSVASDKNRKHTQKLLADSQKLSSELQEKEVEMQENLEKLVSAQEEMRHHQMELDGLFRAINNYLVTAELDMQGKVMGTNKNLLHLFGYKYEEVIGLSIKELLNQEKILSDKFWENLNLGNAVSKDILCQRKMGKAFWLRVSFTPVENTSGDIYKVLMLGEDVTEKKLQEVELQSHLEAIDKTIAAIEFGMDGSIRRINPIYAGITAYKPDELQGRPYSILLPQNDKNNPQSVLLWENLQNGQFFSGVFRHIDKQGKAQWLNGTFNPILDINGKPKKVMMFADFITEGKEKQNELQGLIKAMKNSLPYLELGPDAIFKKGNQLFFETFGYKRMDLQKKDLSKLMAPASFKKFGQSVEAIAEKGFIQECFDWINSDGDLSPFRITLSAIYNLENQLEKLILLFPSNADSISKVQKPVKKVKG